MLGGLISAYCAFQLRGLLLPGLFCDESLDARVAQEFLQFGWRHWTTWPHSVSYHAALQSYLLLPFMAAVPRPFEAVRIAELGFSLLVILSTYFCARRLFNPSVAILTLVFLLPNPNFVYLSRIGISHGGVMAAFYLTVLLCLWKWAREGRDSSLQIAAFLMGAGISIRLWFFWFGAGMLLALPFLGRDAHGLLPKALRPWSLAGMSLAFTAGAATLVWKEVAILFFGLMDRSNEPFSAIIANFPVTYMGENNLDLPANLSNCLSLYFLSSLSGRVYDFFPEYPPALLAGRLPFVAAAWHGALLLTGLACAIFLAQARIKRHALFISSLLAGMLLCSLFTISSYRQDRLFILFPLPQIVMAVGAWLLLERALSREPHRALASSILLLFMLSPVFQLWQLSHLEDSLLRTGGTGIYTDATVGIARWLEEHHIASPMLCDDAGFHDTLWVLTKGRVSPLVCDLSRPGMPKTGGLDFKSNCLTGDNLYIFLPHSDNFKLFSDIARETIGKVLAPEHAFLTRDGRPAAVAYTLRIPQ